MSENLNIIQFIHQKAEELKIDKISIISLKKIISFYKKNNLLNDLSKIEELSKKYKTVICAAFSYNYEWNNIPGDSEGYIARYTTANFYKILSEKLKKLNNSIKHVIDPDISNDDFSLISINSNFVKSNINDKLLAHLSGLGFYCKNSLITINNLGQRVVLGELFINIDITKDNDEVISNEIYSICGECNKCILSCPTGAIIKKGIIDKNLCIQHLSSRLDWPDLINGRSFYNIWDKRFFGCTTCLDICPLNKNNYKKNNEKQGNMIGYIDTNFDLDKILDFKKEDYKLFFKNNQISANWIPSLSLIRNCIVSLYNLNRIETIVKYLVNINDFEWDENEMEFIKKLIFSLLKDKVK